MQLKDYLNILWRRKWIILLTTLVTLVVVAYGTSLITPMYQASTTLRVAASAIDTQNYDLYIYNERLMNTYAEIAISRPILDELAKRLGLRDIPDIKAEVVPNTELIKITVTDPNPALAVETANALADTLIAKRNQLYTGGEKNSQEVLAVQLAEAQTKVDQARQAQNAAIVQTPPSPQNIEVARQLLQIEQSNYSILLNQYEQARLREEIRASMITVVEAALIPQEAISPNTILNYVLGLLIGLLGGLVAAFIFENLDSTLYTTEDIETTAGINTIAKLPHARKKQLNILQNSDSPLAEAFRKLVARIQAINPKRQKKILLVMSPVPQQGVSMVVSNLAYALSEYGNSVIAVDCNLRHPMLHNLFSLPNEKGLTDVLEQKMDLNQVIQDGPNDCLHVLTSGRDSTHPGPLIASAPMAKLINDLGQRFDIVLMDTPALLAAADIQALIQQVGGLMLVVRRSQIQREALREAVKFLAGYPDKLVGLIINEAELKNSYSFYQYKQTSKLVQNWAGLRSIHAEQEEN